MEERKGRGRLKRKYRKNEVGGGHRRRRTIGRVCGNGGKRKRERDGEKIQNRINKIRSKFQNVCTVLFRVEQSLILKMHSHLL